MAHPRRPLSAPAPAADPSPALRDGEADLAAHDARMRRLVMAAAFFALAAITTAAAARYDGLEEWPPASLATMVFSGALLAAVSAREARATGRRWPWVPIWIAGVAIAAGTVATIARIPDIFR